MPIMKPVRTLDRAFHRLLAAPLPPSPSPQRAMWGMDPPLREEREMENKYGTAGKG